MTMTSEEMEGRLGRAGVRLMSCPVLRGASTLADDELHDILIQRRFLSLAFTPFYDAVIDALHEGEMLLVCRQILREEYPDPGGNTPSHHELLVADMVALGVDIHRLRTSGPTVGTSRAIIASLDLVAEASRDVHSQVAVATTVACFAESLVVAEYQALRSRLEKALPMEESVFYGPHLLHDAGHAKRLIDAVRFMMVDGASTTETFDAAIERSLQVKLDFYRQFEAAEKVTG